MNELVTSRRELLIASLVAGLPMALFRSGAAAAGPDPTMTIVKPPAELVWSRPPNFPEKSVESATLWSKTSEAGLYYYLVKWHPGYMSAPHWYETDRLCVVLSGTWYVASGEDFVPEKTVPVPAGSFVRRVARTPHYDGVIRSVKESAVIAISGIGPIHYHLTDPNQPGWREV